MTAIQKSRPRTRNSAKAAGRWVENAWRDVLISVGFDADRLRLRGSKDIGDVGASELRNFVFECKNVSRINLGQAWSETEKEVANAGAEFGVVIHKRHGNGDINAQWATMTTGQLALILKRLGGLDE